MKTLSKFAVIGAVLLGTLSAAVAQQSGTMNDNTGNQSTGGSGNQQPDSAQKKSSGGQGG